MPMRFSVHTTHSARSNMGESYGVQGTGWPTADLHPSRPNGADHRGGWTNQFAERERALLLRYSGGQRLDDLCQRGALGTAERRRHQPLCISHFPYQSAHCACRKLDPAVLMMKAAEDRLSSELAEPSNRPMARRILVQ